MKVSVIIPTYNRSALVVETLNSVLSQTYMDKEIIVVDDGSTDNTEGALRSFGDAIRYVRQENAGVNAARNTALELAQGEYIALLDSDDLWKDYKLALEVEVLDEYRDVGFVYSDFTVTREDGEDQRYGLKTWYSYENDWDTLFDTASELPSAFLQKYPDLDTAGARLFIGDVYYVSLFHPAVLPSASLYRRSMTPPGRIFNEADSTCGDWEFFSRLSRAHGAAFIELETAYNRSHEDEVRLTRLNAAIQRHRQIKLVDRLWRADEDFMAQHANRVNDRQYELYCDLIRICLLGGDTRKARAHIESCDSLGITPTDRKLAVLRAIASTPLAPEVVRALRRVSHLIRR